MKLLHTSDWHLGMTLRGGVSYLKDQKYFINEILRIAIEEKVDGIIIAGDVFDNSVASAEAIALYDDAMTQICIHNNIKVYMIAGNHDGARRLSQCNELLKKSGLYVVGDLKRGVDSVRNDDVDIYLLPWITTDKVKTVYSDRQEEVNTLEDAYRIVLDEYRKSFVKGHKNIIVSHAFIVNATTSVSDRAAEVGKATMISASVFEGFDYVALGHIHGPQDINEYIRYSGTPMSYSFGKEEKQMKSVTIIDTDTMEKKIIGVNNLRKRITLTGTYDELMTCEYGDDILNAYIRLEISDRFVGLDLISQFKERFENLLEISGKSLEKEDARITMTIEELDNAQNDPQVIFRRYCEDILEEAPSEHVISLFRNALSEYERESINK